MGLISPGVGWALNGLALYRTVDDGAHWSDITPPGTRTDDPIAHIDALDFLDADHAWAAVAVGSQPLTIDRSADGGRSWQAIRPNICGTTTTAPPCGTSVHFVDRDHGWGVGGTGDESIYRTTDGGTTWRLVTLPATGVDASRPRPVGAPQFFGRDGAVVAALTSAAKNPPAIAVYQSSDGGTTWITRPTPADAHVGVAGAANDRFTASTTSDWTLLVGVHLSVTHDAGRHWSTLTPTQGPLAEVDFASATSAWLLAWTPEQSCPTPVVDGCADTLLLHTTDGGTTWRPGSPTIGLTAGRLP